MLSLLVPGLAPLLTHLFVSQQNKPLTVLLTLEEGPACAASGASVKSASALAEVCVGLCPCPAPVLRGLPAGISSSVCSLRLLLWFAQAAAGSVEGMEEQPLRRRCRSSRLWRAGVQACHARAVTPSVHLPLPALLSRVSAAVQPTGEASAYSPAAARSSFLRLTAAVRFLDATLGSRGSRHASSFLWP